MDGHSWPKAPLNGKPIRVSQHRKLAESIVSIGFAKTRENLEATLPYFNRAGPSQFAKFASWARPRWALTYVANGRFDAYIERGIQLWDIAAGGLILECAGGEFWHEAIPGEHTYRMIASNGLLRRSLEFPGNKSMAFRKRRARRARRARPISKSLHLTF